VGCHSRCSNLGNNGNNKRKGRNPKGKGPEGKREEGKGYFFEPTVIGHCNHTMEIMHRESFGPIVGLQKVNNDDDAVSLMNDNLYGLTAAVYGKDEERATAILRDIQTGTCYWNTCDRVSPYLPWTGVKHSGFGSTLGLDGIRNFLRPRAWHMRSPPVGPKTITEFVDDQAYSGDAMKRGKEEDWVDTTLTSLPLEKIQRDKEARFHSKVPDRTVRK